MTWTVNETTTNQMADDWNDLQGSLTINNPVKFEDSLFVFCGDSTTEQAVANGGMFDRLVDFYAKNNMLFDGAGGFVNYGGSGQTLDDFLTRVTPNFTGASKDNPLWNYEGVKPVGAVGLDDAVSTPEANIYVVCYGINDMILTPAGAEDEQTIIDNLYPKLVEAVKRIKVARPKSLILLRTPNVMTARPVNPSFPSSAVYPDWGDNEQNDQELVLKWNNALRRSYIKAKQELGSSCLLIDTVRYSIYDRGVTVSADDRVEMTDCVHPSPAGYSAMADGLAKTLRISEPVRGCFSLANRQEGSDSTPAYSIYPEYMADNTLAVQKRFSASIAAAGTNYVDIGVELTYFNNFINTSADIYLYFFNVGTVKLSGYNPTASGSNTRLLNVSIPQYIADSAPTECKIYQDLV